MSSYLFYLPILLFLFILNSFTFLLPLCAIHFYFEASKLYLKLNFCCIYFLNYTNSLLLLAKQNNNKSATKITKEFIIEIFIYKNFK